MVAHRARDVVLLVSLVGAFAAGRCPAEEPKLIPRLDAFRTLVNPDCSHCVDEARRRAGELRDDDRVLAWTRGKYQGGAVPFRFFLAPYRVISDTYGVFVFDPEAGYARGFEPSLEFTFYGWRGGVLVIRHQDGTLFSALSGRAFAGPRAGERLKPIATIVSDWGDWNAAYPGSVAYRMYEKYRPQDLPDKPDEDSLASRLPADSRLEANAEIVGIEIDGHARAYPVAALAEAGGLIRDRLAERDIVVLWHAPTRTAAIYAPEIDEGDSTAAVDLSVDATNELAPFLDRVSGSHFGIEGRAHAGPLAGQALLWLDSVQCRWFAWAAEYPETEIYQPEAAPPREAVLVEPDAVSPESLRDWRGEGFGDVVLVLDEAHAAEQYAAAAPVVQDAGLGLYYWMEIARNPRLADEHPQWVAGLGIHDDWRSQFPDLPPLGKDQVAKAYPWAPIGYAEAYAAHLERVRELLARVPDGYRGLLLNDLQGGPASCGCGNLQCRWALDYHVPATAERLAGDDVAARFVAEVAAFAPGKEIVPIWTTECEMADLPDGGDRPHGTCLCGSVPCATGLCPIEFGRQWNALCAAHRGAIGALLLHKEFSRHGGQYGDSAEWIDAGLNYLEATPLPSGVEAIARRRLWLVVQGYDVTEAEERAVRAVARRTAAGRVLVARTRIDQSYEPRMVTVERDADVD